MSNNKHSSDGLAEDLIRSFTQLTATELHLKTLIEKRISEVVFGLIEQEKQEDQFKIIENLRNDLEEIANLRRDEMLFLYELYESRGNKEYWCIVKHLSTAMFTAFECYQASELNSVQSIKAERFYTETNKQFIKALTLFLGVEITPCASCFGDILKTKQGDD